MLKMTQIREYKSYKRLSKSYHLFTCDKNQSVQSDEERNSRRIYFYRIWSNQLIYSTLQENTADDTENSCKCHKS